MRKLSLLLVLLLTLAALGGQNTLSLNGINEAQYVYRTVEDSLNTYFKDSFGFNLGYRGFSFGMKFIAELPKYKVSQSDLMDELSSDRLSLAWKELYASYAKDAYLIHAGTIEDTFGSGLVFRSYQDLELDEDNRVTGFKFGYDDKLRLKAIYSALDSPQAVNKLDLAYGLDLEYPVLAPLTLGATTLSRQVFYSGTYNEDNMYGGRVKLSHGIFDASAEYANKDQVETGENGNALYASGSINFSSIQFGGAYKNYNTFVNENYVLKNLTQDIPLANHHSETLSDGQISGVDEVGFQGWATVNLSGELTLNLDYAEAWNEAKELKMNDAYASLDWIHNALIATASFSQIEKVDDATSQWQKEWYPGLNLSFPAWGENVVLAAEFKTVEKQSFSVESSHYEPRLQLDFGIDKLSLSLGAQSWWEGFDTIMESRYWPYLEAKYPVLANTELVVFGGKEAGGKVCRNGVCRYVAPFSGLKVELSTRF